ncbi:hypothetical protein D3C74_383320 [compost metagenome]
MVVKVDILLNGMPHLLGRVKGVEVEAFGFKMTEEVLHAGIVPAVPFSGHTGLYLISLKQVAVLAGRILKPLVAVQ